jgi:hypothetical protein
MALDLTSVSVTDISQSDRLNALKLRDNCNDFQIMQIAGVESEYGSFPAAKD